MKPWNYPIYVIKTRLIYIYAVLLSLLSIFFVVNPVIGQTDIKEKENQPEEKISIIIQYDDEGNISRYDSSYVWSWSGNSHFDNFDSIMEGFDQHLDNFHFYMDDNIADIDELLINPFSFHYCDSTFNMQLNDWESRINENEFLLHQEKFLEHFQNYMEEHRKLMEKYFSEPFFRVDTIIFHKDKTMPEDHVPVKTIKIKSI